MKEIEAEEVKEVEVTTEENTETVSVPYRGTTFLNTIPAIPPSVWAHGRDCVGKIFFGKINKIHLLKSAATSVFKLCAAKSKQTFSFIKKYPFHIVPSYILSPDSGYISRYVVKPSFLYLYSVHAFVAHRFCQRYLLLFQYLLFHQT